VTVLVRELLAEGWLVEGEVVSTGDIGRRPTPLFIDPNRLLLLGAEVSVGTVRVVAVSLAGKVLARLVVGFDQGGSPAACVVALLQALLAVHEQLDEQVDEQKRQVIGIGVGLPGGVDEARGFLHFAPNLGWRDVPVGALLTRQLSATRLADILLFIQNEADVAALGEIEFNPSEATNPTVWTDDFNIPEPATAWPTTSMPTTPRRRCSHRGGCRPSVPA